MSTVLYFLVGVWLCLILVDILIGLMELAANMVLYILGTALWLAALFINVIGRLWRSPLQRNREVNQDLFEFLFFENCNMSQSVNATQEEIEALWKKVESALINFAFDELRGKFCGNGEYHKLVLEPNGNISYHSTAGRSVSPDEYYREIPHELTIAEKIAEPWSPGPGEDNPGWQETDGKLDMTNWCGREIKAEEASQGWREELSAWIEEGNFRPSK